MHNWLLIILSVAVAACEVPPEERVDQACSSICACTEAPLPALQDRCVADCKDDLDAGNISDECIDCIAANSDRCSTLEATCKPICQPPPVDVGGNGP